MLKRFSILLITILTLLVMVGAGWADTVISQQLTKNDGVNLNADNWNGVGQTFVCGVTGKKITSVVYSLTKSGTPAGTAVAKIYLITGTSGTDGKPTGSALATSDPVTLTSLTTSLADTPFSFSGVNQVTLTNGTAYCVTIEFSGMTGTDYIGMSLAASDVDANNNKVYNFSGTWYSYAEDAYFILYGVDAATPPTVTCQDASTVDQTTATLNGNVTVNNGTISAAGFYISTVNNPPTAADTVVNSADYNSGAAGTGAFTGDATSLTANTTYHCVAFATNAGGTSTSANHNFTTLRNPGTFYMSATGTAANIAAATGVAHPANYMNVTVHNAGPFVGDDVIKISDKGGIYTSSIIAPSSGSDGHPIIYKKVTGETPTIDLSLNITGGDQRSGYGTPGWTEIRTGVYESVGYTTGRVLWEDGVALKCATSNADVGVGGQWYYEPGYYKVVYQPTSGVPSSHTITTAWFEDSNAWLPYGFDLRNISNIEVSGLTLEKCGIGHSQNMTDVTPLTLIKNIKIHDNTINRTFWAIWGNLQTGGSNGIEQDVEIYNNTINYCNSGISTWTNGAPTDVGHAQHPLRHNIHNNTITHHYSIDDNHSWQYACPAAGTDHEVISFQDPMDCTIADNTISQSIVPDFSDTNNWTRAIYFFVTTNGASKTSGNKILRNRISGIYVPAIYISGTPTAPGGIENNIYALNVLKATTFNYLSAPFQINMYAGANPATGVNYFINNTIDYPYSLGYHAIDMTYGTSGYWTYKNNIATCGRAVSIGLFTGTPFVFDHNNYYCGNGNSFRYDVSDMIFAQWQTNAYGQGNLDATGSAMQDPKLRASDSAITSLSPGTSSTGVIGGGTTIGSITGITGITAWPMTGVLAIDGKALDGTNPAMGAYAEPVASPTVSTEAVSGIHATTATGGGTISGDTGWTISEDGVAIGASANPTIAGTHFNPSPADITGAFTVPMTGLTAAAHYHARAFITTELETIYGADVEFDASALGGGSGMGLDMSLRLGHYPGGAMDQGMK